jgi:hypothetical protein
MTWVIAIDTDTFSLCSARRQAALAPNSAPSNACVVCIEFRWPHLLF